MATMSQLDRKNPDIYKMISRIFYQLSAWNLEYSTWNPGTSVILWRTFIIHHHKMCVKSPPVPLIKTIPIARKSLCPCKTLPWIVSKRTPRTCTCIYMNYQCICNQIIAAVYLFGSEQEYFWLGSLVQCANSEFCFRVVPVCGTLMYGIHTKHVNGNDFFQRVRIVKLIYTKK